MKVITLLPIRNEAWILPHTLKNFSSFSDVIIVADQNSQDGSKDICKQFEKVRVIENTLTGHSNQVRWMLLDEARMIPGNNLIVCLDADEMIDPRFVDEITSKAQPGQGFSSQWLQLWNAGKSYRTDGPWKDARKVFAFWDDRTTNYLREEVVNDHTGRIPQTESIIEIDSPILHLQ
jgi:glycosyltransferase involved in cell wall biosynthesis